MPYLQMAPFVVEHSLASQVHTKNKPLGEEVDLGEIARTTAGFAGADLENLMNESAINAAKDSRKYITKEDVDKAFIKVGIGTERKSRIVPESERRITAYHEAGHAILFHVLEGVGPVYTVSIIPTGQGAAGYTMPLPENDNVFNMKGMFRFCSSLTSIDITHFNTENVMYMSELFTGCISLTSIDLSNLNIKFF